MPWSAVNAPVRRVSLCCRVPLALVPLCSRQTAVTALLTPVPDGMSSEVAEHEANLAEYQAQIEQVTCQARGSAATAANRRLIRRWLQVEALLLAEPGNLEYAGIHESLTEVIDLTQSLLKEARQNAATAGKGRCGTV